MSSGLGWLAGDFLREQDSLNRVEPIVFPGFEVFLQFIINEPAVKERFVLLVDKIWLHRETEKLRVFLGNEKIQLMASMFGMKVTLFFQFQLRPIEDK